MAEGSVGSVWHNSLSNLPSITVDPLFPSFPVRKKLMKMQFFNSPVILQGSNISKFSLITTLRGMQTWSSDENYVCLSVRLFVKRVIRDKTK